MQFTYTSKLADTGCPGLGATSANNFIQYLGSAGKSGLPNIEKKTISLTRTVFHTWITKL